MLLSILSHNLCNFLSDQSSCHVHFFYSVADDTSRSVVFDLYAVLCHVGSAADEGHFMVHAKSSYDGLWYTYNDSEVRILPIDNASLFVSPEAYVLFYRRVCLLLNP
jgi:ubiquitin C-terminal hydrolase